MKRIFKNFNMPVTLIFLICFLLCGNAVAEDVTYNGSEYDDEIYFGVARVADPDDGIVENRLFILRYTKIGETESVGFISWDIDPAGSRLTINGREGNDHIEALAPRNQTTKYNQRFENIAPLANYEFHLYGDDGHDTILGTPYVDRIYGQSGNDWLNGNNGDDWIWGGQDNDFVVGNGDNDHLYGDAGNDILIGHTGLDYTSGGEGTDTFRCRKADHMQSMYDPANCAEDCDDGAYNNSLRNSVEQIRKYDPYRDWAMVTIHNKGVYYEYQTTSNPELLFSDRAAGASILLKEGGDIPFAGDFNADGYDDVGVFRADSKRWYFNLNTGNSSRIIDAATDGRSVKWALPNDRPVAGRFNRSGSTSAADGIAVFRPSTGKWYFDYNRNGITDKSMNSAARGGDIPFAGDFDGDGYDDIGWFRPSNCQWYIDYNFDGDYEFVSVAWGLPGDIPIAGDFNGDGRDDIGVFRPSKGTWYFHWNLFNTTVTNDKSGPWGVRGDIPIAGDFNGDGLSDTAVFRLSNVRWYFDFDHDGDTDPSAGVSFGAWGWCGMPLMTVHKQYGSTCGPASLAIVMDYLGLADRSSTSWWFDPDLKIGYTPDAAWTNVQDVVHVGYKLSMEHIMYEGYVNDYEENDWDTDHPDWYPNTGFLSNVFVLNTAGNDCGDAKDCAEFYGIDYPLAWAAWDSAAGKWLGNLQNWMIYGQAVGTSRNNANAGLPFVANKYAPANMKDALPVSTNLADGDFQNLTHLKTVIKNYIDNHIPAVIGVDDGGHFNTIIGYWETKNGFYIYSADPLDGWGRAYWNKPMRWRKFLLNTHTLNQGGMAGILLFGHSPSGCSGTNPWASRIDSSFSGVNLCNTLIMY
jgi:hypothetical protein